MVDITNVLDFNKNRCFMVSQDDNEVFLMR